MIEVSKQKRAGGVSPLSLRPTRGAYAPRSPIRWGAIILLAILAGLLIVNHGCHGDEDTELFSRGWWMLF